MLDHVVMLFLIRGGDLHIVSHSVCANLHSQTTVHKTLFLLILASTCHLLCFDDSHSDRCEVISHCGLHLHFPDGQYIEHIFMCLLAICMSFLGKKSFQILCCFLISSFSFYLVMRCISSMYLLNISPLFECCLQTSLIQWMTFSFH